MDISSLDSVKQPVANFLHRYHLIIFIVVVVGLLIFVMFKINSIIQSSSSSNATAPTAQKFDQTTMDKIRNLHSSGSSTKPLKLTGRYSPFVE